MSVRNHVSDIEIHSNTNQLSKEETDNLNQEQDALNQSKMKTIKGSRNLSKAENVYLTILSISVFSSLGCMIRVGLDHAVGGELANIENPSSVVFKSFFSNMLGSFMIGVLHALPLHHTSVIYVGVGTGLCGSVTTYSKWNQQVSMLLVGAEYVKSQAQLVGLSAVIVGLTSFVCSYQFGKDLFRAHTKKPHFTPRRRVLKFSLFLSFVCLYTMLSCLTWYFWIDVPFVASLCLSAIVGPVGSIIRHFLSLKTPPFNFKGNMKVLNVLPTGTLLANVSGSIIVAGSVVFESWVRLTCSGRIALMAFQTGFLASLTTVSSLVSEIVRIRANQRRLSGYLYSVITLFVCVSAASIINGVNHLLLSQYYQGIPASANMTFYQWKADFQPSCSL